VNHPGTPSWESLVFWLVASIVGFQLLASVLPRLLPVVVLLAGALIVVRLVWFWTDRH
jgi:hypothetical protein